MKSGLSCWVILGAFLTGPAFAGDCVAPKAMVLSEATFGSSLKLHPWMGCNKAQVDLDGVFTAPPLNSSGFGSVPPNSPSLSGVKVVSQGEKLCISADGWAKPVCTKGYTLAILDAQGHKTGQLQITDEAIYIWSTDASGAIDGQKPRLKITGGKNRLEVNSAKGGVNTGHWFENSQCGSAKNAHGVSLATADFSGADYTRDLGQCGINNVLRSPFASQVRSSTTPANTRGGAGGVGESD